MSAFIQLSGVSLAFGDRDILKNVHINLSKSSRTALAGANGSGKTTFMKVIFGEIQPDSGECSQSKELRTGYLPQSGLSFKGKSLKAEVEQAWKAIVDLESEAAQLAETMAQKGQSLKTLNALALRHHEIQERITASGYYEREAMIYQVLTGLGFSPADLDRPSAEFSGGWQMRIALARILLEMPDILLLDEPTNYLDLEARDWLEEFLRTFPGGVLVVSHDRYFLDQVTKETAELFQGSLKIYKGNYSAYEARRKLELEQLEASWKQQQEEIAKIEDFIRRFRYKDSKAAQVQSRIKMLEKMERIEIPPSMKAMHFNFPPPPHSGKRVLQLKNISKAYGTHRVMENLNLDISRGDRLNLAGVNGAGKSTLMRIISGEDQDFTGERKLGSDVKIAFFSQDQERHLNPEQSVLESLEEQAPTAMIPKLRGMLGAFLFSEDDIYKKCGVLSGGEKNRLALLKLLLEPANLLVMDEPTNHLDLKSKDVLLKALKAYTGTLVFVSHDRYFIEELAGGVLELRPGHWEYFDGDYSYYRWKKSGAASSTSIPLSKAEKNSPQQKQPPSEKKAPRPQNSSGQMSREEAKQQKAVKRRLEREEARLMEELENCEALLTEQQERLALPEIYSHGEKARQTSENISRLEEKIKELNSQWEHTAEELAALP